VSSFSFLLHKRPLSPFVVFWAFLPSSVYRRVCTLAKGFSCGPPHARDLRPAITVLVSFLSPSGFPLSSTTSFHLSLLKLEVPYFGLSKPIVCGVCNRFFFPQPPFAYGLSVVLRRENRSFSNSTMYSPRLNPFCMFPSAACRNSAPSPCLVFFLLFYSRTCLVFSFSHSN